MFEYERQTLRCWCCNGTLSCVSASFGASLVEKMATEFTTPTSRVFVKSPPTSRVRMDSGFGQRGFFASHQRSPFFHSVVHVYARWRGLATVDAFLLFWLVGGKPTSGCLHLCTTKTLWSGTFVLSCLYKNCEYNFPQVLISIFDIVAVSE